MKAFIKYFEIFLLGGVMYIIIELLFRGRSHWTMFIAGGICFLLLYTISVKSRAALWKKWIMGGVVITTVEFITGVIVNIKLGWNVWDYSQQFLNISGQICALFTVFWIFLSIPGVWLCKILDRQVFMKIKKKTSYFEDI